MNRRKRKHHNRHRVKHRNRDTLLNAALPFGGAVCISYYLYLLSVTVSDNLS